MIFSSPLQRIDLDGGRAVLTKTHAHAPRPAAHLAILFVILVLRPAPIEQNLVFLSAIGADHDGSVVARLRVSFSKRKGLDMGP